MVGAIQVTGDRVETPEEVAATIRAAMEHVDVERDPALHELRHGADRLRRGVAKLRALGAGAALVRKSL